MNNRRRIYFAEQAAWFTSQFDADAIAQRARIVADGGEVIDFNAMQTFIKGLKDLWLYDNLLACWSARFGIKKDALNYVEKIYDVSTYNRDAFQNTGSNRAIWGSNSGRNGLQGITFDAVNDMYAFSQITSSNITIIFYCKYVSGGRVFLFGGNSGELLFQVDQPNQGSLEIIGFGVLKYFKLPIGSHCRVSIIFTENNNLDNMKIYIDDTLVADNNFNYPQRKLGLIASYLGGGSWRDVISESYVLDTALSITQIQTISAL